MIWIVAALGVLFGGAFLCLATIGRPSWTRVVGPAVAVAAALLGLPPVLRALSGSSLGVLRLGWSMPFGSILLALDALSAVFALPILAITALSAIYGSAYLRDREGKRDLAISWFFFHLLTASMLLVVLARDGLLFLLAWEAMSIASFFLVMFDSEKASVRRAGWTYLIAAHIGAAFLLALFALLGRGAESLEFSGFARAAAAPGFAGAAFLLALIGFGAKAGFIPLHVWLPEAHPAAPSHVSAVMSGVMIKTGIYGLLRVLTFLGTPPPWWGWSLVAIGVVSGVLGVLFALAQHDLKRLLAYHSVENIGIIALGIGIGLLGLSYGSPAMAFLGLAGALLHVINHAVFKSLLFLSAGSVIHAAGTGDIEHLGGLLKRLPATGLAFLVGSAAICGLPPLNGFVSEFLIYLSSLRAVAEPSRQPVGTVFAGMIGLAALALIGGLAVACFVKAFGVIFLGEPRSSASAAAHESGGAMKMPMAILATTCAAIGLGGSFLIPFLQPAVGVVAGLSSAPAGVGDALTMIAAVATGGIGLALLLYWARNRLLRGREVSASVTWDCGYIAPSPRMQYTASSFADPLMRMFRVFLRTRRRFVPPMGFFPASSSFSSETPDLYQEGVYRPIFSILGALLARLRLLQHGRLNLYILGIVLALVGLLVWKL